MATLNFKGKSAVWNHHLSVPYHTLEKNEKNSLKGQHDTENLIVQGDNLLALKALLPQYQGKVKCIYIDPPYNTGNEGWVYSDSGSSPTIKEWVGKVVGKDGEDLTRHDKWLCMMTPRLKLLRELLTEDGVIFVSIDDNEQHHLRVLMDDIFTEKNFITNIIWQKKYSQSNDAKFFSDTHDFVMVYAKNSDQFTIKPLERTEEQNARYENSDNDERGVWMSQPLHAKSGSDKTYTHIFKNGIEWQPPVGTYPRYNKATLERADEEGRIWFGKNGTAVPRMKKFLTEMKEGVVPKTIWMYDEVGSNDDAKKTLKELFNDNPFESPKPVGLIKRMLQLSTGPNDLVLDSFAGSGTTAQAVLELNQQDGGKRNWVLVEMEDYADRITAERVRRVIKKSNSSVGFSYFALGPAIDAETLLAGNLPEYKEFAKYVYYLASGKNHSAEKSISEKTAFVGKVENETIYLLYKQDIEALKKLAITLDWARDTHEKDSGKKIVYAPACYLDDEALEQYSIKFVSIPYNLFERT